MSDLHTPGPWTVDEDDLSIMADAGPQIASVIDVQDMLHVEPEDEEAAQAQCLANAYLIAAAPVLVAALTVCMEAIDAAHADPEAGLPSPSWHWWKAAREAPAAARSPATPSHGGEP